MIQVVWDVEQHPEIKDATGFQKIELRILDLSSFQSVKDFVNKYEEDGGRLDILIQNAGLMTFEHEDTVDGWESWYKHLIP